MKTTNVLEGAAIATEAPSAKSTHKTRNRTYIFIAVLSMFVALAGFSLTYIVPVASRTFTGRSLLHVHGLMYFLWLAFFILQPVLVRSNNTALHRKLGVAGFVLAGFMIIMGITVAVTGARLGSATLSVGGLEPKQFVLIPFTDMVLFATFLSFSLANLKRFDYHKRLMVLATLSLLPAAFGRLATIASVTNPVAIILTTESLLLGIIVYEWITTKKVHPAYKWGAAFMIVIHLLRFPLAGSAWWTGIGEWIVS
jgi:hypothetical protein